MSLARDGLVTLVRDNLAPSALDTAFLNAVVAHRQDAVLASALRAEGRSIPKVVEQAVQLGRARRLRARSVLAEAGAALDRAGFEWLIFKGPVLAARYRDPSRRSFVDLDLLVHGSALEATLSCLSEAGFESANQNWLSYIKHSVAELPVRGPLVSIDLHWDVIGLGSLRREFAFDPSAMLDRRRLVAIGSDQMVPTFDAADQLLHLCVHAGLSGAVRLDWMVDIDETLRTDPPDWDEFVRRSRRARTTRMVAHVLDRAQQTLGTPLPDGLLSRLGVSRALLTSRRLDDRRVPDLAGGYAFPGWLVSSQRDRVGALVNETAKHGSRAWQRRRGRPAKSWDVADQKSELYFGTESGGDEARSQYFELAGVQRHRPERGARS